MKVTCEYMMIKFIILWNFSRLSGPIYSVELILLKLMVQHICCFYNYFENSPDHAVRIFLAGLIPPIEHILAWYKISLNPLLLTNFSVPKKMHEIIKIPEIYNDVPEFIWINPYSSILFLCCTHINCNMCILHVWNLESCIDLCFASHTVLNFVIGQGMDSKNVNTVWKVSIINNWINCPQKLE